MCNDRFLQEERRDGCLVTRETKQLWQVLLTLAEELKRVCVKYHLRWFLHAGSLLGAIRHEGFIPWDDDMDFVLPRRDFDRLLQVAPVEFSAPFFLQTLENSKDVCIYGRARLRMDGTTGVQRISELYARDHQGICIDITALDALPDEERLQRKQQRELDRYGALLYLKKQGSSATRFPPLDWGQVRTRSICCVSKLLPDVWLKARLSGCAKRYSENGKTKYCIVNSELFGAYRHTVLERSCYETAIMRPFENTEFPVPGGYHEILRQYYGEDYMALPPEQERTGHHNPVLSVDEPYTECLSHFQNTFQNTKGKQIVVFGAGEMLRHYLQHTRRKFHPLFVVDNDRRKWGKTVCGLEICAPERILEIAPEKQHVIICSIYYKEIKEQLKAMGIHNYYIYVQKLSWL